MVTLVQDRPAMAVLDRFAMAVLDRFKMQVRNRFEMGCIPPLRARPSAFAPAGLRDWPSASGGDLGRAHPAAVQAKADRSPRPASNRVMNQGRGRSGFRPCVKNCRIYSERHELCCFDAKEASS